MSEWKSRGMRLEQDEIDHLTVQVAAGLMFIAVLYAVTHVWLGVH